MIFLNHFEVVQSFNTTFVVFVRIFSDKTFRWRSLSDLESDEKDFFKNNVTKIITEVFCPKSFWQKALHWPGA